MTPSEIRARVRELKREVRSLLRRLPKSPAQVFRGPTRKQAMKARREAAREHRRRVYAEVDARSNRLCEAYLEGLAHEHDHFFGRGRAPESVETVWALCRHHHRRKGDGAPTRAYWIEVYRAHCERHGYTAQVEKCDRALALEKAQRPAAAGGMDA